MPLKDVSVNFNNEYCATIFGAHPCKNVITLKPGIFTDSISTITLSYLTLTQFNTDVFVNMNEYGNILIKNRYIFKHMLSNVGFRELQSFMARLFSMKD